MDSKGNAMQEIWQDAKYRVLANAEISDALDFFGLPGSAHGLSGVTGTFRFFGPAYTLRFAPVDKQDPGTVGDFIDDVLPGQVIVLDNGGRTDCTVWGGILSQIARSRGIAGTVIHGVCRDVEEAVECGYPIFSRGTFMRTGKDRVQVEAVNQSVSLGDVRVNKGDLVCGDRDGIVVVPASRIQEVLDKALAIHDTEQSIVDSVKSGLTLKQAREKLGYHQLQRSQ
jgi:regulator of RNase E activity RraA